MLVTGAALSRASGKSPPYISAETKRSNLIKGPDRKYNTSDPVNKNWLIKNGMRVKTGVLVIDPLLFAKAEEKKKPKPKPIKSQAAGKKKVSSKPKKASKSSQKKTIKKLKKQDEQEEKLKKYEKKRPDNLTPTEFEELIELPGKLKDATLEQLVIQHSYLPGMRAYAELLDKIMSAVKKSVEIQKIRHELIERDFFKSHVKAYLDVLSEQLLDYCGTDKKMLKDFSKMIQHAQRNIDRELGKLQKIQEAAAG